jgi:preprotein translocase subunit SecG
VSAIVIVLHIIVCIILILAVLLQSGKAADLAGAFGGGGSQTAFGARGQTSLLAKITTASAILFMVTSLGLWILSGSQGRSVVGGEKTPAVKPETTQTAPEKKEPAAEEKQAGEAAKKAEAEKPPIKTGEEIK